jgi:transcriptional regulator with XRE-family HTH domain
MAVAYETIDIIISEMDWYLIKKVKELRTAKELSQLNLASLMDLTAGAIGKIENPKQRAKYNIRHLNLLAKALKCSPRELIPAKPLSYDMIKVTLKIQRNGKKNRGLLDFQVLKIEQSTSRKQKKL